MLSRNPGLLFAGVLVVAPLLGWAQTTSTSTSTSSASQYTMPESKLIEKYTPLAGSEKNAKSLVTGLRDGSQVKLESKSTTESFTPPTGKMGYGNVNIALALAEAQLAKQGITDPTPAQLEAALMGGTLTSKSGSTKFEGVLQMRADGKGWGQVANSMGFKLGEVMRPAKIERTEGNARADRSVKADRAAKVEHAAKPERPVKVERVERPERLERVSRPERPERAGR